MILSLNFFILQTLCKSIISSVTHSIQRISQIHKVLVGDYVRKHHTSEPKCLFGIVPHDRLLNNQLVFFQLFELSLPWRLERMGIDALTPDPTISSTTVGT
jgi:hypothetical protein